ncbi:MAG: hypothetical protein Q8N17_24890 [Burkholderiaceae bacterium]|nr:hypothetical protein [Burkholderiaceae bacterium]
MSTRHSLNKAGRTRQALRLLAAICLLPLPLGAADTPPAELERLFFTPAQRADMQTARNRPARSPSQPGSPGAPSAAVKFDGVLIRSDGKTTHWVDGKAQTGTTGISNMKPGQVRANGKLYEPYQVQRPPPPASSEKDPTP